MTDRTVTSPAGEDILVLPNDDFATLAGFDARRTFEQNASQTPMRMAMLTTLWRRGAVVDRDGFATTILANMARTLAGEPIDHPTAVLTAPSMKVCVERKTHGKRTKEVRLVALPECWLPTISRGDRQRIAQIEQGRIKLNAVLNGHHPAAEAYTEPPDDGVTAITPSGSECVEGGPPDDESMTSSGESMTSSGPPSSPPAAVIRDDRTPEQLAQDGDDRWPDGRPYVPPPPAELIDLTETTEPPTPPLAVEVAEAVATALLAQVAAIITQGNAQAPANDRLRSELSTLTERLGTQVDYVDKLRRDLRASTDQIAALKVERDGLRQRLRDTEHNLRVATSADTQRIIDAEVHRQLDKVMRQAPNGQHHPVEAAR